MAGKTKNYNLVDEDWIPVLWNNGQYSRVGIRTALTKAGKIRQIAASNPMDRFAILRFLLAVLYWCKGNPPDTMKTKSGSGFPPEWFDKLESERECFNLLGNGPRFYQRLQSGTKAEKALAVNYLIHEIPTGTNSNHFRRSIDYVDGLCPACIAIGLLRLPVFSTSGGRGKPPGINSKPPFYMLPLGASLAETLELSWIPTSNLGEPSWKRTNIDISKEIEVALLIGLTWLPRQVWLNEPQPHKSICIACGAQDMLIYDCVFSGVGTTKDQGAERIWRDPHVLYLTSPKGEVTPLHAPNSLNATDSASGKWRDLYSAVLADQGEEKNHKPIWFIGFSTIQNDKYLEAVEYVIPSHEKSVGAESILLSIKAWQKSASKLVQTLIPLLSASKSRKLSPEARSLIDSWRPHIEGLTCNHINNMQFREYALSDAHVENERKTARLIADSLAPGVSLVAEQKREGVKRLIPTFKLQINSHDSSHS